MIYQVFKYQFLAVFISLGCLMSSISYAQSHLNQTAQQLVSSVDMSMRVYATSGMGGLQQLSQHCYTQNQSNIKCIYVDVVAERIHHAIHTPLDKNHIQHIPTPHYFTQQMIQSRLDHVIKANGISKTDADQQQYLNHVRDIVETIMVYLMTDHQETYHIKSY